MPRWALPPVREPELMDDPSLGEAEHVRALGALARINTLSRTASQLADAVIRRAVAARLPPTAPLRIVDVACGGGDVTVALARRLERRAAARGWPTPDVVGIDVSPRAVERATRHAASHDSAARFLAGDITVDPCPPCDIAVSSLFLHHLDDAVAERLLTELARSARLGVVVSDLIRSRLGLALATVGTTLLSTSRVARVDGPRSVRAARTPAEYHALFTAAGLAGATVRRVWPERVLVEWPGHTASAANETAVAS